MGLINLLIVKLHLQTVELIFELIDLMFQFKVAFL